MRVQQALASLFFLTAAFAADAQTFDFSASSESVAFEVNGPVRSIAATDLRYDLGFIYQDDSRNNTVGSFGLNKGLIKNAGLPGLDIGAGGRFYLGDIRGADISAIAPGVLLNYTPAVEKRVNIMVLVDYAPSILTFNDGKRIFKFDTRFSYEIIDNTHVYLGFRDMEAKIKNAGTYHVDVGWNIGIALPL